MEHIDTHTKFDAHFFFNIAHTRTYFIQTYTITWVTEANVVSPTFYVKALA